MHTTSISLLERLRQADPQEAWERLVKLYTPLLSYWARRLGLQDPDAADLVQDVLLVLIRKLPEFSYDRRKSFRSWLRTIVQNKWRDKQRRLAARPAEARNVALSDLAGAESHEEWGEAEYRQHLVTRALHLMKTEFSQKTWKACWEHVVGGRPANEVAAELGVCVGAVYVAKSRVLCRLRQELAGLLE